MSEIRVECYSGYRADERPVRFHLGENSFEVAEVQDSWYSPGERWFRVLASDRNIYVLRHDERQDIWTLDAFRAAAPRSADEHHSLGHA
jgi:hypothetical protein